ncbi:MAG: HAD-IA family hydrolase [Terracidiphilus sp.]
MFPFDAILFDVGGVLLTNGWDHRERAAVMEQFHLDRAAFEARHAEPNDAWERDTITVTEYLDATVFYEPRSFTHDEFLDAIRAQSQLLPDTGMGILGELAASDKCMVGVLNNEARATNDYRLEKFGIWPHLKVAFSSCYVGLRKPGTAIYQRALDILGKPARRVLFIDDRAENAAGAEAVGMKAIRFTGAEALRGALGKLGVL